MYLWNFSKSKKKFSKSRLYLRLQGVIDLKHIIIFVFSYSIVYRTTKYTHKIFGPRPGARSKLLVTESHT